MDGMLNSEKWTDAEVQALLAMYATEEVQRDLEGSTRNIKIFGKISSELAQMGVYHTVKQCREKVKKLKQDYKKIKDHNNQSGANRNTPHWTVFLATVQHTLATPPGRTLPPGSWRRSSAPRTLHRMRVFKVGTNFILSRM